MSACRSSELVKSFTEDCYSVSVHPNGLAVLLGFADKLRLMTVLMDDFRQAVTCCTITAWSCNFLDCSVICGARIC